jgi:hypothetical protein
VPKEEEEVGSTTVSANILREWKCYIKACVYQDCPSASRPLWCQHKDIYKANKSFTAVAEFHYLGMML